MDHKNALGMKGHFFFLSGTVKRESSTSILLNPASSPQASAGEEINDEGVDLCQLFPEHH
ncbi:hypothetical protein P4597_01015 [Peribacillus simplex]|uniref:hypothetical protein n=1 Tax=Peribacillus simplex TaxID=1478 RepID=UPI002E1ECF36|nr:hypothetical protein [Peribacillus simplex]